MSDGTAKTGSILLVDDDQVFLQTLSRSLQRKRFEVTTAFDSTTALNAVEQRHFDLILLARSGAN